MKKLISLITIPIIRLANKLWKPGWTRFFCIFVLLGLLTFCLVYFVGYKIQQTEYPETQIVNGDKKDAALDITLESFSLTDRSLEIQANYWLNPDAVTDTSQSEEQEVRIWISKPYKEATATGGITATPRFGTPVNRREDPSTLVLGTMTGEPFRFPFDKYSASIGEQNDFNRTIPFKFKIENHLVGFKLASESGGDHTATITLERTLVSKYVIPFVPMLILFIYTSWVTYLMFGRKVKDNVSLVANVALFISILSLRTLVVPNGIPFGCMFDLALIFPTLIIIISIFRIIQEVLNSLHQ